MFPRNILLTASRKKETVFTLNHLLYRERVAELAIECSVDMFIETI
jgi:hypothetical protein